MVGLAATTLAGWATPLGARQDASTFEALTARSIGPAGMSGRISAIDAVADQPTIMYAGAGTGGVWKSVDGGLSWDPVFDDQPVSSVGAVAVHQRFPDVVWVGTGEKGRRNSSGVGNGVYRSIDGGDTWTHLGLDESEAIAEVILHPDDPDVAWVAALGKTWADGEERGVFKTTDGGSTWSRVLYVDASTGAADLVMHPRNPNKLFAAMWDHRRMPWTFRSGGPGSGLYVSHNGGDSWTRLAEDDGLPPGELGRMGLAIAPGNPNVVYALVEASKSVLLRSDDGGRSWNTVNDDDNVAPRPFYYAQLAVDPENENRLYNIHSAVTLSTDGGASFAALPGMAGIHPDHHAFWINPREGRLIVDGNDGGIAISRDRGASFRFVENLPLAQFYHISVDLETPYHVYGGLQDNGSWRGPSQVWETGGIKNFHWMEVGFGDGFATIINPTDPRYGYSMSQGGNLSRFDVVTGQRKPIRPWGPDSIPLRFNWNAAIAVDPHQPATVYYGSQFVHRSPDGGGTWEIISPDLTTNDPEKQRQGESGGLTIDNTTAENHTTILTIAPSAVTPGVIWVGTDDGNVQLTRDAGATWTNVGHNVPGVPGATWVPHIEASRFDAATAFVVFDDHRRGNWQPYVFKTTNFGEDWTSLVTDSIRGFAHVLEQDPVNRDLLFLGTEFGLYVSVNGGANWFSWRHGLPTAPVRALVIHPRDRDLVIGTHGRGAYIVDDIRALEESTPEVLARAVHLFGVPAAYQAIRKQPDGFRFTGAAKWRGENTRAGAHITYHLREGGTRPRIEILDGDEVIRTLTGGREAGVNRVRWDLRRQLVRGGPRVPALPGTYTVRMTLGDDEVTGSFELRPDPRIVISDTDRRAKYDAIVAFNQDADRIRQITRQIRSTVRKLDPLIERVLTGGDSTIRDLRREARALKEALEGLQQRVTPTRDVQGISGANDGVSARISRVNSMLNSSWEAPTQNEQMYVRQARAVITDFVSEANRVFAEDYEAFRTRLRNASLDPFPSIGPWN